ncbi:MAG TPA: metallophosphoesterase family protein [Thermomicrobiales bacterium]|nr:metallophosphoesterase family protein [Thermomicrobiales bacterium]
MSADMRIGVLSDVHGNLPALTAVLDDIDARGQYDELVAAGDHCLNGPDPADALDTVHERCASVLIGNTDRDIVDGGTSDPELGEKKRASIQWTRDALGGDRIRALADLRFDRRITAPDGSALLVVHANPIDVDRHIFPDMADDDLAALVEGVDADVLAFGHLHIPFTREFHGLTLANIAACGLPRDGDRRAAWGEFTWTAANRWTCVTHRVEYDYGATVLRMLECGMPHPERRIRDLLKAIYD